MKKLLNIIYLSILYFCFGGFSFAQKEGQFIDASQDIYLPFTVTVYGTKQGLPQNQVLAILPKANGNLVLSTANGIIQYNGIQFFDFISHTEYKQHIFKRLIWNTKQDQLIGVNHNQKLFQVDPSYRQLNKYSSITIANRKTYGLKVNGDFVQLSNNLHSEIRTIAKTKLTKSYLLFEYNSHFYAAKNNKLYQIQENGEVIDCGITGYVLNAKQDPFSNAFFVLTNNGVYQLKGAKSSKIKIPEKYNDFTFSDLEFVGENERYIATDHGLISWADYGFDLYDKTSGLPSFHIRSLYFNKRDNCLFAGTDEKGLLKLQFKTCSSFSDSPGLADISLNSIVRTNKGEVLVGGMNGTIYQIAISGVSNYFLSKGSISCLSEIDNTLILGTWGDGLILVKDKKVIQRIKGKQLKSNVIHGVFQDSENNIWVATDKGISFGKTFNTLHPVLEGKIKGRIICFYELRDGRICIGGTQGVFIVDKKLKKCVHISRKLGFNGKEVRSFLEDREGKLWIGTYDYGVFCYFKNKLVSLKEKTNCKLNNDAFTLARDDNGYIYITSNQGLWVIHEKKLNDFYYNKIEYLVPYFLGNESGIINTEFNGGFQNNYSKSPSGHFYFPTIQGVIAVHPDPYEVINQKPSLLSIVVNGKEYNSNQLKFNRETKTLSFSIYQAYYNNKNNLHYQYKLEGAHERGIWSSLQNSNEINFTLLQPGKYLLRIRSIDGSNQNKPKELVIKFSIESYFFETVWFRTLFFLISIGIIIFYLIKRIDKKNKTIQHENSMKNTMLELKLKSIQAKINPHFIFNTLNNIQYLIIIDKKEKAEQAIGKFSKLLRKFLLYSDKSFIKLSEEIAILELYLEIEKHRFDSDLKVEFDIDSDTSSSTIPTLLLQPIVENAIKHGFSTKEGQKILAIRSKLTQKGLTLTVQDNGIGFEQSKLLNKNYFGKESYGWNLVIDKIKMLDEKYNIQIGYEIKDAIAPETGTTIYFFIPNLSEDILQN